MLVVSGRFYSQGRLFEHGEPVPYSHNIPAHILGSLMKTGALRDVTEAERDAMIAQREKRKADDVKRLAKKHHDKNLNELRITRAALSNIGEQAQALTERIAELEALTETTPQETPDETPAALDLTPEVSEPDPEAEESAKGEGSQSTEDALTEGKTIAEILAMAEDLGLELDVSKKPRRDELAKAFAEAINAEV